MVQKITKQSLLGNGFIKVMYPGVVNSKTDTGIKSIGRIDHAYINGKTTIDMHPHSNDEILSYFRSGQAKHIDSENITETINSKKLMLMKAGKIYYHEEEISSIDNQPFEGLQIFIRPSQKDLTPEVSFYDLSEEFSFNQWRLLASPTNETPLRFTSQSWVWDTKITKNHTLNLAPTSIENKTFILYVYKGEVKINDILLEKQDAVLIQNENINIITPTEAELVLFATDNTAQYYDGGMYSGNKL